MQKEKLFRLAVKKISLSPEFFFVFILEETPLYATTVKELNALISQYNTLLKGRTATPEATKIV